MTQVRRSDTSVIPAAQRANDIPPHPHDMPTWAKVLFVVFAASVLLTVTLFYAESRARDRAIIRELDRRTDSRDAESAETRDILCRVLMIDLADKPNAADLAEQYECP